MKTNTAEKKKFGKKLLIIVGIIIALFAIIFGLKACNTSTYTITFKNYDDSIVDVVRVKEGEIPSTDKVPTRPSDDIYEYVFESWGNITKADKDTTYTAIYKSIPINKEIDKNDDIPPDKQDDDEYFIIYFLDDDGSIIERRSFIYGSIPYCSKDIPDKTIDGYLYTFAGWNKLLSPVISNGTYIATYNKFYVGDGGGSNPDNPPVAKYTVTFSVENGTAPSSQTVTSGSKITQPDLNCGGYIIEKWYEDALYTQEWDFTTSIVTNNITLYGQPTNKFVVVFDYKGKGINNSVTVNSGSKVSKPTDPTYSGLTFMGWQYNNGSALVTYDFNTSVTAPFTLYAQWGIVVTFDKNGKGTNDTLNVELNSAITKPTSPTYSGYTFKGWYTDAACSAGKKWNFSTTVSTDKTLYAKWINVYPEKGDVIKLNDNKTYRVLKMNDKDALVLYLAQDLHSKYWNTNQTTEFEPGYSGVKYDGSILDNYLNNTWYASLDDSAGANVKKPMYDAIKTTNLDQHIYTYHPYRPTDDNYALIGDGFSGSVNGPYYLTEDYNHINVGERKVFALGVEDLIEYFGKDNFTTNNLRNLYQGPNKVVKINSATYYPSNSEFVWFIEFGSNKGFLNFWRSSLYDDEVHPTFLIDLSNEDVDFVLTSVDKYTLTTAVNNVDGGSVQITGGPKYNVGTEVILTAKEKSGYMFVGWSDGVTTASRKITVNATTSAQTFTANFEEKIPAKGDIVTLGGKKYRVLNYNSANGHAKLLSLYDLKMDQKYYETNATTTIGGYTATKYDGSDLDTYLNTTWYESLDSNIKNAIVEETSLKQNIYSIYVNDVGDSISLVEIDMGFGTRENYLYNNNNQSVSINNKKVYAPGFSDLLDYLGVNNLRIGNIKEMLYGPDGTSNTIWLRSAVYDVIDPLNVTKEYACTTDPYEGSGYADEVTEEHAVHAEFTINLKASGLVYDLTKVPKATINLSVDDDSHGSVIGSGTFNKGTEVSITAIPKEGYVFVSWGDDSYDSTSNPRRFNIEEDVTLEAKFAKLPSVGDIIKLNDNKNYRILELNDSEAILVGLYNLESKAYDASGDTTTFNGTSGIKYYDSDLYNYFNDWLNDLYYESSTTPIYYATYSLDVVQNMFTYHDGSPVDDNFVARGLKSDNNSYYLTDKYPDDNYSSYHSAFVLDVAYLIDYLGEDNLTKNNINKIIFNSDSFNDSFWLASADSSSPSKALYYNAGTGSISSDLASNVHNVYPAISIDLSSTFGLTYEIVEEVSKHTITVSSEDNDMGSVRMTGGPEFIEGTEVLLTAKSKSGYRFKQWEDGNTDNPRIITVTEDKDYKAIFELAVLKKGSIITFDDDNDPTHRYRVLKIVDDDNDTVLLLSQYALPENKSFNVYGNNNYKDSVMDDYINNTWYGSLDTESMLYKSIIQTTGLNQYSYILHPNNETPQDENYVLKGNRTISSGQTFNFYLENQSETREVGDRFAFILDIQDIADYLGKDDITTDKLFTMFNITIDDTIWLRSARKYVEGTTGIALRIEGTYGGITSMAVSTVNYPVYPAFTAVLSKEGVSYTIE